MKDLKPVIEGSELKLMAMRRDAQQYSYDLTQRLTFFVISIELVFCGYILLNSDKLGAIKYSSWLFLFAGSAAVVGIIWRFIYNQTFHNIAHGEDVKNTLLVKRTQLAIYWIYILLTGLFLVSTILAGYCHLHRIEAKAVTKNVAGTHEASQARLPIAEAKKDSIDKGQPKDLNEDHAIK